MDKSKLYYYYWGLLSDAERREVDDYLTDPARRAEYETLAESFSAISSILGTDRYRKKRIPLDAVRSAYRRRRAVQYARISAVVIAIIAVIGSIILAYGYYQFQVKGRTGILLPESEAVIGFIENRIAIEDSAGRITIMTEAGRRLMPDETVFTDTLGKGALVVAGCTIIALGPDTRLTLSRARIDSGAVEISLRLTRGDITVYERPDSTRKTVHFESGSQHLTAENGYRFIVRRSGGEERILLEGGTIRMAR